MGAAFSQGPDVQHHLDVNRADVSVNILDLCSVGLEKHVKNS